MQYQIMQYIYSILWQYFVMLSLRVTIVTYNQRSMDDTLVHLGVCNIIVNNNRCSPKACVSSLSSTRTRPLKNCPGKYSRSVLSKSMTNFSSFLDMATGAVPMSGRCRRAAKKLRIQRVSARRRSTASTETRTTATLAELILKSETDLLNSEVPRLLLSYTGERTVQVATIRPSPNRRLQSAVAL